MIGLSLVACVPAPGGCSEVLLQALIDVAVNIDNPSAAGFDNPIYPLLKDEKKVLQKLIFIAI